jgi:hypothetical protein
MPGESGWRSAPRLLAAVLNCRASSLCRACCTCCATGWNRSRTAVAKRSLLSVRFPWTGQSQPRCWSAQLSFLDVCRVTATPRRLLSHQLQPLRACAPTIAYEYVRRCACSHLRLLATAADLAFTGRLFATQSQIAADAWAQCSARVCGRAPV